MLHSSIVQYYAEHESYKCGYCKRPDTNFSHGMWAHSMTVSDYQDLIDRGWRRSGKYCYKPTMDVTCCPMYTIRCNALDFKPSKSQKKVLKKFNKYLMGQDISGQEVDKSGRKMSTCSDDDMSGDVGGGEHCQDQFVETTKQHQNIDISKVKRMDNEVQYEIGLQKIEENNCIEEKPSSSTSDLVVETPKINNVKKGMGPDPTKGPCKKSKQLRWERKVEKLKEKGVTNITSSHKNMEKQLEDFINELPDNAKDKIEIRLVRTAPRSPEWLASAKETHEVYVKYQMVIHGDSPHKCTERKFKDFLVASPLLEEYSETGPPKGYGSFHQQYLLNGKIIAVGVIDILPKCVSSVYFFYDPAYTNLTLGTYGALREIAFTRHLHSLSPALTHYYMGYYIHSCLKMRYKGNFLPSDLLCPETYKWFPIQDCISKLNSSAYSRLDSNIDSLDENCPKEGDLDYIPVISQGVVMLYKTYKTKFAGKKIDDESAVMQYAILVGAKASAKLILAR